MNASETTTAPTEAPDDPGRRRALLLGGGALALVIGGGVGWIALADDDDADSDAGPGPSSAARDPLAGVVMVGERYLADHPEDADLDLLLAELPAGGDDPVGAASTRVAEDFGNGATVVIDGWVLAISEARAAAVVALRCRTEPC